MKDMLKIWREKNNSVQGNPVGKSQWTGTFSIDALSLRKATTPDEKEKRGEKKGGCGCGGKCGKTGDCGCSQTSQPRNVASQIVSGYPIHLTDDFRTSTGKPSHAFSQLAPPPEPPPWTSPFRCPAQVQNVVRARHDAAAAAGIAQINAELARQCRVSEGDFCIQLSTAYAYVSNIDGRQRDEATLGNALNEFCGATRSASPGVELRALVCTALDELAGRSTDNFQRAVETLALAEVVLQKCISPRTGPLEDEFETGLGPAGDNPCMLREYLPCVDHSNSARQCVSCCDRTFANRPTSCKKSCYYACKCWRSRWPDGSSNPFYDPATGGCNANRPLP